MRDCRTPVCIEVNEDFRADFKALAKERGMTMKAYFIELVVAEMMQREEWHGHEYIPDAC